MSKRFVLRAAAIVAASTLVLAGAATSASAHVTVSSPDAKPGGYAKLVFRVPTESDTARTTKLVVSGSEPAGSGSGGVGSGEFGKAQS